MTVANFVETIKTELGDTWLPNLYRTRVLKLRTRAYNFGTIENRPRVEIQHTLLGVELKVGRRRFLCPDLATARYLSVFARAGCKSVAVPYDITKVSLCADELESSWYRMLLLADHHAADRSNTFRTRIHGRLIAKIRAEIAEAGAGATIPEFRQSTKQRK